ncbi:type IV pilus modification PilV family protein [Sporosarcina beigongshangi]|uniref:type IV pilus modification PilV family protein n=1 Tax=Sporosarcina beigongshangi TaxID=2782538 RepID=UPI001939B0DD|nr:prepilin-type N-terminal cleavage/methylation domain-containing protein [Sporosarcina beigongshangi]
MKNDKGFSLLEVLASIVLLSIILLSFFQIFIQTNNTAVSNNEKLVVIHLADAVLERLKLDPFTKTLERPDSTTYNETPTILTPDSVVMNNKEYQITIKASQNTEEKNIKLINVLVEVVAKNGRTKSSVEGYVSYE